MNRGLLASGLLLLGCLVGWSDQETGPTLADLEKQAAAIKPVAEELRWQQIPWLTDLAEGQRVARAERRPIFLWVTGDDPLERC
jgi:hypothetical protein